MNDFHLANPDWYPLLKEHARRMRNNPTEAEDFLWRQLKGKGLNTSFKRQCVILDYIADFYSPSANLIIEGTEDTTRQMNNKHWMRYGRKNLRNKDTESYVLQTNKYYLI